MLRDPAGSEGPAQVDDLAAEVAVAEQARAADALQAAIVKRHAEGVQRLAGLTGRPARPLDPQFGIELQSEVALVGVVRAGPDARGPVDQFIFFNESMRAGAPVLGVIYLPASGRLFAGTIGEQGGIGGVLGNVVATALGTAKAGF